MEENDIISLIAMETAEPKRKMIRSAGSVYVILIALVIGTISLANLLYARWQIPRYIVQPTMYALIVICGIFIYQRHSVGYRYTLTELMFAIERVTVHKEQTITAVPLENIIRIEDSIRSFTLSDRSTNASTLPRKLSRTICIEENGSRISYRISPSKEFLQKLLAQHEIVKSKKEIFPV